MVKVSMPRDSGVVVNDGNEANQHHRRSVIKRGEKIFTQKFRVAVLKDRREPVETTECN
jgi:hypothetical protein